MARAGRDAAKGAQDAQRLREEAQRLLERATPAQREELRRWADQLARERGSSARPAEGPRSNDPVDARRPASGDDPAQERVLAEWLSDRPGDRTTSRSSPAAGAAMRDAVAGAERAIERQSVPARQSEFIRRVFRRYGERAAEAGAAAPGVGEGPVPSRP